MTIYEELHKYREEDYAAFQARSIPNLSPDSFQGIRVPNLRKVEKAFRDTREGRDFLLALPHQTFDENLLHSIFISNMKDPQNALEAVEAFLPYVDNWAVCDTLHPKAFRKLKPDLYEKITDWISSSAPYTIRFGIDMLMTWYLGEDFSPEMLALPASVRSDDYYVRMMQAWYYATALTEQWDTALPWLKENRLTPWVHNKAIQKARESYRISKERKECLKALIRKASPAKGEKT